MSIYAISKLQTKVIPTSRELRLLHAFWFDSIEFTKMFEHTDNPIKWGDTIIHQYDTVATSHHGEEWQGMMIKKYPEQWMSILFHNVGWFGGENPPVDMDQYVDDWYDKTSGESDMGWSDPSQV